MMKEKQIRTWLPFIIVASVTFFLSEADMLQNFGTRLEMIQHNQKLLWLLISGDGGQALVWLCCSIVFFVAWKKNRFRNIWYSDIYWQLSGIFFCWFFLCLLNLVATFFSYLWLNGMVRLFVFVFGFYFLNTLYAARTLLFNPETPDEALKKAKKFEELIKLINNEAGDVD